MKKLFIGFMAITSGSVYATTLNGFDATLYGFVKASATYATEGLASYNNINLSAPTHATAQTRSFDKTSRMSFQTQQSRVGVNLKKGDNITSKLEFDFIDFNKSSPTTQMVPRVRIASVTYAWGDQKIIIGQDWDLFSPVTSFTFDYVGLYFLAGNTGFMRQQIQYLKTLGDWEIGAAVGMAGNNPGTTDTDLELAKSPSYAARISHALEKGRIGLSGIYARLNYATGNGTTHDSYAGNAFYEQIFDRLQVKSEAYYGKNLANIGALSIGKGTSTADVKEFGGMLTGHYKMLDQHFLFGGAGFAQIDGRDSLPAFALTSGVITSPGIQSNVVSRLGWEYRISDDLSWMTEVTRYQTKSKIAAHQYQLNIVGALETGVQLRF